MSLTCGSWRELPSSSLATEFSEVAAPVLSAQFLIWPGRKIRVRDFLQSCSSGPPVSPDLEGSH